MLCGTIAFTFNTNFLARYVSLFAGDRDAAVRGSVAYVEQSTVTLITSKRCEQPCVR